MRKQHMKIKVIIPNSGMDRATLNSRQKMLSKPHASRGRNFGRLYFRRPKIY